MTVPKVKPTGWSVAGQKKLDAIKPNMPSEMVEQIKRDANLQGIKDVFGYDVEFDSQGRPIEKGIGSDYWLMHVEEEQAERHWSAVSRFVGPAAAAAGRERIKRMKESRGK